jgi:hypothetical protein
MLRSTEWIFIPTEARNPSSVKSKQERLLASLGMTTGTVFAIREAFATFTGIVFDSERLLPYGSVNACEQCHGKLGE